MPSIKQGQTLTKEDLNVFFYIAGNLSDPFNVTYTLFDSTTGTDEVIGLPNRYPIKFATGSYYAPWTIPDDEPIGLHKIKWYYKDTATSDEKVDTEEFQIIPSCSSLEPVYPDFIRYLIQQLRIKLRDVNPDADYHFSSPSSEQTIAGFTRTRGYRWTSESLYSHLMQAANYINLVPPDTGFSLESYPAVWQPILLNLAMSYALWDLAILWINEEFSYSLNGISLDISRSDKYQSVASSLKDQVNQELELAKKRVHLIAGLAQNRYIFSRGCLSGDSLIDISENQKITIKEIYEQRLNKALSTDFDTIFENEIINVFYNGKQKLYKLSLEENYELICTANHIFFNEQLKELKYEELKTDDKIWVNDKCILKLNKVKIKEFYKEDDTFDLEMKKPYSNYLANGIVVHNSALGPWCLSANSVVYDLETKKQITIKEAQEKQIKYSYSMDLERKILIENKVNKIWTNGIQELFKANFENNLEIICTKTHKFFKENDYEIELQDLKVGDKVWVKKGNLLILVKFEAINFYGYEETYDMEMEAPYHNYIADEIVVHNTTGQNAKRWILGGSTRIRMGF